MRMLSGDFNIYYTSEALMAEHFKGVQPDQIRAACYGTGNNSGGLVPEVGDVIQGFHGYMGAPVTVRVVSVQQFGAGVVAFMVDVAPIKEESAA